MAAIWIPLSNETYKERERGMCVKFAAKSVYIGVR